VGGVFVSVGWRLRLPTLSPFREPKDETLLLRQIANDDVVNRRVSAKTLLRVAIPWDGLASGDLDVGTAIDGGIPQPGGGPAQAEGVSAATPSCSGCAPFILPVLFLNERDVSQLGDSPLGQLEELTICFEANRRPRTGSRWNRHAAAKAEGPGR